MTPPTPLAQKLAGGLFAAFGEHLIEQSPELKVLAQACGYTAAVPPSKALRRAQQVVRDGVVTLGEALADGERVVRTRFRERMRPKVTARSTGRHPPTSAPPVTEDADLPAKLAAFLATLAPAERDFLKSQLTEEARASFVDLHPQPDGSYGAT